MREEELFKFSEHDERTRCFKESDLYKIVQALRSEFGLTNWEWLAGQLDILCFSAYGAEVSAKMEEENSWHKVSKIEVMGDRYWNDNNTASFDWWKGDLYIIWKTSSGHEVHLKFRLDILGDGDDKYNWSLQGISFGKDKSENFYPLVKGIIKSCVGNIQFSDYEIPRAEVIQVYREEKISPVDEKKICLDRLNYLEWEIKHKELMKKGDKE